MFPFTGALGAVASGKKPVGAKGPWPGGAQLLVAPQELHTISDAPGLLLAVVTAVVGVSQHFVPAQREPLKVTAVRELVV